MTVPRMISQTVVSQVTKYHCFFEIESNVHIIEVEVTDNKVTTTLRKGPHSHQSLSDEQWQVIKSEVAERLLK